MDPGRRPVGQFKVDTSHPLAKNLYCAYVFNEKRAADLVQHAVPEVVGYSANTSSLGPTLATSSSSAHRFDTGLSPKWLGRTMSMFITCKHTGTTGSLICQRDGSSKIAWQLYQGASNLLSFRTSVAQSLHVNSISSGWNSYGITVDFGNGTCRGHINGDLMNPGAITGIPAPYDSEPVNLSIGHRWAVYPTAGYPYTGDFAHAFVWEDRMLTDDEQKEFYKDPYQILIPVA